MIKLKNLNTYDYEFMDLTVLPPHSSHFSELRNPRQFYSIGRRALDSEFHAFQVARQLLNAVKVRPVTFVLEDALSHE